MKLSSAPPILKHGGETFLRCLLKEELFPISFWVSIIAFRAFWNNLCLQICTTAVTLTLLLQIDIQRWWWQWWWQRWWQWWLSSCRSIFWVRRRRLDSPYVRLCSRGSLACLHLVNITPDHHKIWRCWWKNNPTKPVPSTYIKIGANLYCVGNSWESEWRAPSSSTPPAFVNNHLTFDKENDKNVNTQVCHWVCWKVRTKSSHRVVSRFVTYISISIIHSLMVTIPRPSQRNRPAIHRE